MTTFCRKKMWVWLYCCKLSYGTVAGDCLFQMKQASLQVTDRYNGGHFDLFKQEKQMK